MAQSRKRRSASPTHTVVSGSTIRFEEPKSDRSRPPVVKVVAQEINPVSGFVGFLRERAVVGLAVGFAIGLQAQTLVKQLVSSFIRPLFVLFFGKSLPDRHVHLSFHGRTVGLAWGAFIYSLLNFIFVLAAIYIIIKFFNLDKLDKPKKDKK